MLPGISRSDQTAALRSADQLRSQYAAQLGSPKICHDWRYDQSAGRLEMRLIENLGHIWRRLVGGSSEQQPAAEPKPHDAGSEGATVERANSEPETQKPTAEEAPPKPAENAASEAPEDGPLDDLTAIRGIGAATQTLLNATGIKSYAQLADADPEDVRRSLNERQQNTKVERWISRARELVRNDWRPI